MSKNHYVGGKGPKMRGERPPKPVSMMTTVKCLCGKDHQVLLFMGFNDVHLVCDCDSVINIDAVFDGHEVMFVSGSVEERTADLADYADDADISERRN